MLAEPQDSMAAHNSVTRLAFVLLALCFGVLLFVPVGKGDLPGYDDALYAHLAKGIFLSGDWVHVMSNGYPALEHPPLLPWMQAAFFAVFGISDGVARLPTAICGFGTVILVYWLALQFHLGKSAALFAMFCMGTSIYFLKYAARAMTDVPFAFFFLCAICCWKHSEIRPRWLLLAGIFTAAAQMTRGMMGLVLPLVFVADILLSRRRVSLAYSAGASVFAFAPPALWYWYLTRTYGAFYTTVHAQFLARDLTTPNPLTPLVFAWMLAKSYWPWFPVMLAGLWFSRSRLLLLWIGGVFAACVVVRNPVLRYLLPAYPAFAIASGIALQRWIPAGRLRLVLLYVLPALAAVLAAIAIMIPSHHDATTLRQMAAAASSLTAPDERVAFYDGGAPRFDESNLLQWYGSRNLYILENRDMLEKVRQERRARVFIVDSATFASDLAQDYRRTAQAGNLVTAIRQR